MRKAVAGGEAEGAGPDAGVDLDPFAVDRIDILSHAHLAAGGHEADTGEIARPLADRDIRDGVVQPVREQGDRYSRRRCRAPVETGFHTFEALGRECGVGRSGVQANTEGTIELVPRGQPPSEI